VGLLLAELLLGFVEDCPVPVEGDCPVPMLDALPVVPVPPRPADPEPHGRLLSVLLLLSVLPLLGVTGVLGAVVVPPLVEPDDIPPAPPVPLAPPAPPPPPPPPPPCAMAKPTLPARKSPASDMRRGSVEIMFAFSLTVTECPPLGPTFAAAARFRRRMVRWQIP